MIGTQEKEEKDELPIVIRPMQPGDVSLVLNSWLKSYRDCPASWGTTNDVYFRAQKAVISKLLSRCNVAIASDPQDDDQIFGWLAWEETKDDIVVHYIYVKSLFQRMGVARRLWHHANPDDLEVVSTHVGPSTNDLKNAGIKFRYKPFRLISSLMG